MKRCCTAFGRVAVPLVLVGAFTVPAAPATAQIAVIDGSNYAQNLLQAARALQQINNQVKSLQNEASMLQAMAKNLQRLDFPQLQKLTSAMQQIDRLMGQAEGIQFKIQGLDQQIRTVFPGALAEALNRDERVAEARAQLDAQTAAYRQAMTIQALVAENVETDAQTLGELAAASQGSVGALQAQQASNQLLALGIKQQLQLQTLMASEFREGALDRARRAQAEEDGRAATQRFLGGAGAPGN